MDDLEEELKIVIAERDQYKEDYINCLITKGRLKMAINKLQLNVIDLKKRLRKHETI